VRIEEPGPCHGLQFAAVHQPLDGLSRNPGGARDLVDRKDVELGQHGREGAGGKSLACRRLRIQAGTAE
jgi:hypothetical protein